MDREFLAMATGKKIADLRIDNAMVVDVFSGTIERRSVCVGNGRILGFGRLEARETLDAQGKFLIPGLIDAHVHIESSMLCPPRFAELVLPFGTTTVVADPHEISNVLGSDGIRFMLESSRNLPLSVRLMLPSCVPALPVEDAGAVLGAEDLAPFLSDENVGGLGEMMNAPGLLFGDENVLSKIEAAEKAGKIVDGHAPALSGSDLDAYLGMGISTDHECTTPEEVRDRIARGCFVLFREGSAARDLQRLLPALTPENSRRCLFCTDDRHTADILERGHINGHLKTAVAAGVDPICAVRMATLNAAECYGMRDRGGIAPGRRADMVLVSDLRDFRPEAVWSEGKMVARNGKMLLEIQGVEAPAKSVHLAPLPEHPFSLKIPSGRARIICPLPHSLVTGCVEADVRVDANGEVLLRENKGLLKIAVLERHHATGKIGVGLLAACIHPEDMNVKMSDELWNICKSEGGSIGQLDENMPEHFGAIATTIAHDSHNIVVAGDDEEDMIRAVREVERMGGGIAMIAPGGRILGRLPLPVAGLMSTAPVSEVAATLNELRGLGTSYYHIRSKSDTFMTLSFLALPVIPHLKITARGLFDVDSFAFVPSDVI